MNIAEELLNIIDCDFYPATDLTSYTTFRLSSIGDLIEVRSVSSLQKLLPLLKLKGMNYILLGWGANQILPPICKDLVIHLDLPFDPITLSELRTSYDLPASVSLNQLTTAAVKFGLKGWEVFTGIPASLGGAIYMNAGTNLGEIGQLLEKVILVTPEGRVREEVITSKSFSYRKNHFVKNGEVIVGATLKHFGVDPEIPQKIKQYLAYRKSSQPLTSRNCGCVFKNPIREMPAGKIIDLLQLKGLGTPNLRISPVHGNFMENMGGATWEEFKEIVEIINFYSDHFFGIEFELEVKIPYH